MDKLWFSTSRIVLVAFFAITLLSATALAAGEKSCPKPEDILKTSGARCKVSQDLCNDACVAKNEIEKSPFPVSGSCREDKRIKTPEERKSQLANYEKCIKEAGTNEDCLIYGSDKRIGPALKSDVCKSGVSSSDCVNTLRNAGALELHLSCFRSIADARQACLDENITTSTCVCTFSCPNNNST